MITRNKFDNRFGARSRGFTLLEVMVSLIITSIGLLGIAKIHALAYSSTATAGTRSLVALQTAGLAANMQGNRTYWSGGFATPIVISGTVISDATLNGAAATPGFCVNSVACTPDVMAAYDLHTYARQLNASLPNSNTVTTISCPQITIPVNCTIQVSWDEKAVSVNTQGTAGTTQGGATATFAPTFTLYVEP